MGPDKARGNALARPASQARVTRGQIWSIVGGTGLVLTVALVLVLIVTNVVVAMRQTANRIDDERSIAATSAAIAALERRLALTAEDNSVWDEAYQSVRSTRAASWIRENWGLSSASYPLYDGVAVFSNDLSNISSYLKGVELEPSGEVARSLLEQVTSAQRRDDPVTGLLRIEDMIVMTAAVTIQPFMESASGGERPVLVLMKAIDKPVLEMIARDYRIVDIAIGFERAPGLLNLALEDAAGVALAFLSWPSRKPGDVAFENHLPLLWLAGATLLVFLLLVLGAGAVETTRLRRIATAAEQEAKRDPLSGALNRGGFLEVLDRLANDVSPERPLTLHMLDLDGFKTVNDTYGHAVGDLLIAAVAVRLAGFEDRFAAIGRLGGDEFALAQVQDHSPKMLAEQVIDTLSLPFVVGEREFRISASIGHASSVGGADPAELMRRADVAMYAAKAAGKCRALTYAPNMEEQKVPVAT